MFMKSILQYTTQEDLQMLDEAFCSVKKLPYYTYFVDGQTREVMPYGLPVLQGIADTAIVLFHVIIALDLKNRGCASGCAPAGSHHMVSEICTESVTTQQAHSPLGTLVGHVRRITTSFNSCEP
jgi:hypothetical protein